MSCIHLSTANIIAYEQTALPKIPERFIDKWENKLI